MHCIPSVSLCYSNDFSLPISSYLFALMAVVLVNESLYFPFHPIRLFAINSSGDAHSQLFSFQIISEIFLIWVKNLLTLQKFSLSSGIAFVWIQQLTTPHFKEYITPPPPTEKIEKLLLLSIEIESFFYVFLFTIYLICFCISIEMVMHSTGNGIFWKWYHLIAL